MRRAVHLEHRAGARGGAVDGVPVEVEVVAGADHPPRRVRDHVDVRVLDRVEDALGQLGTRLAARDVERSDDQVERREQLVWIVELAVGADLELAAVQQAEALVVRLGRRRPSLLLRREALVEGADERALFLDALGGEAARDRERLRVIGHDLVGVAAAARELSHGFDRHRAVGPVRMGVEVALEVGLGDEIRQAAGEGRLDLAAILAQLRLDERQPEKVICLRLRGEDAELTALVRGDDLAGLVDPGEAVLAQAPALVARHRSEPDVVLLRAGEMDEVGAALAGPHDHEVDLWAAATEADRRLVQAAADDRLDRGQTAEHLDDVVRVVGLRQEIEVTDRFPPPAVRAGGHDASHVEHVEEAFRDLVNEHLGLVEEQPPLAALEPGDALEDQLLGALRETLQAANPAALGRHPELLDRLYPEVAVDQSNGLRPDAGQPKHLEEAGRELGEQLVAVLRAAGRGQLVELVGDRLADARNDRRLALAVCARDLDRGSPDGVRGAVVGHGLVHQLALDLEQVADVVEHLRELAVAQQGDLARRGRLLLGRCLRLGLLVVAVVDHAVDGIEAQVTAWTAALPVFVSNRHPRSINTAIGLV